MIYFNENIFHTKRTETHENSLGKILLIDWRNQSELIDAKGISLWRITHAYSIKRFTFDKLINF